MKEIKTFKEAKAVLMMDEGVESLCWFPGLSTELLLAIAKGEVDAKVLAGAVLSCRGMDDSGKWIGFKEASKFWEGK